jgi:hypothetical protein
LILSPVGLLIIAAGRLIIVANFNTTTAVTIASSGGFVNTLLGSVIPMVPVFIPYLALFLLLFRRFLLSAMTFVLTVFISPTLITLNQGLSLAKSDWHNLVAKVTDYRTAVIVLAVIIVIIGWAYNRSFAEGVGLLAALVVATALVVALPETPTAGPLRLASNSVSRLESQTRNVVANSLSAGDIILFLLVSGAIFIALRYGWQGLNDAFGGFTGLVIAGVALCATIALFPYIHYIYPAPQDRNYYAEATHAMWVPDERIVTNNHRVFNGYVLSSDSAWYTVLLSKSRTIAFIPAGEIIERSVCQPGTKGQLRRHRPLIPWFYHRPPKLPACKGPDVTTLSPAPIRARHPGEAEIQRKPPADMEATDNNS